MISLKHTNDMMRAISIDVPTDDEGDSELYFSGMVEQPYFDFDERPIMDAAGWDIDCTPVDSFMSAPMDILFMYGAGMHREGWDD